MPLPSIEGTYKVEVLTAQLNQNPKKSKPDWAVHFAVKELWSTREKKWVNMGGALEIRHTFYLYKNDGSLNEACCKNLRKAFGVKLEGAFPQFLVDRSAEGMTVQAEIKQEAGTDGKSYWNVGWLDYDGATVGMQINPPSRSAIDGLAADFGATSAPVAKGDAADDSSELPF